MKSDKLKIAGKEYTSRLILGTGKYKTLQLMQESMAAAEPAMVTVAIRRVNLNDKSPESFWNYLPKNIPILPNTAGCYTVQDAVRTARLAREILETDLIKLEVIGDEKTLLPDTGALLAATEQLVKEGFVVMPYTTDDLIIARKLVDAGASVVMPLAAPIGSGRGILNSLNIKFILDEIKTVPVIVDAGVGVPSDACLAMELGCDGVLMNTAVAGADDPVSMAKAMKLAVESGTLAYHAGRIPIKEYASPSSPTIGVI